MSDWREGQLTGTVDKSRRDGGSEGGNQRGKGQREGSTRGDGRELGKYAMIITLILITRVEEVEEKEKRRELEGERNHGTRQREREKQTQAVSDCGGDGPRVVSRTRCDAALPPGCPSQPITALGHRALSLNYRTRTYHTASLLAPVHSVHWSSGLPGAFQRFQSRRSMAIWIRYLSITVLMALSTREACWHCYYRLVHFVLRLVSDSSIVCLDSYPEWSGDTALDSSAIQRLPQCPQ